MIMRILRFCSLGLLFAFWLPMLAYAQALPPLSVCNTEPKAPPAARYGVTGRRAGSSRAGPRSWRSTVW